MKAILPQLASKRSSVLKFAVLACCAAATTAVPWASTAVESVVTTTAPSGPFNRNSRVDGRTCSRSPLTSTWISSRARKPHP